MSDDAQAEWLALRAEYAHLRDEWEGLRDDQPPDVAAVRALRDRLEWYRRKIIAWGTRGRRTPPGADPQR